MTSIIGSVLIVLGCLVECAAVFGVFRFDYMLNRIHSASMGDTLAALLIIVGCMFLGFDVWHIIKLFLVLALLWMTSPISGNFIARVERMTNVHWKERVWREEEGEEDGR